ncbi:COP9 signalosome complex subunit 3 [Phlyctochytrium bullatum]|nr:COP9 signalosome complex subunit 3 [Phlyctochytrium bullatum]
MQDLLETALLAGDSLDHVRKAVLPKYKACNASLFLPSSPSSPDPLRDNLLDPRANSLAYLFFLAARLKHLALHTSATNAPSNAEMSWLLATVMRFARVANTGQLWLAPARLRALCVDVAAVAERMQRPAMAVAVVTWILKRSRSVLDRERGVHELTPLHPLLMRWCLASKLFGVAKEVLDVPISGIQKDAFELRVQDYLLYMYYGGNIYLNLSDHAAALSFYTAVLTAPSQAASAIQVAAYRRAHLASLIATGRPFSLPKSLPPGVARVLEARAVPVPEHARHLDQQRNLPRALADVHRYADGYARAGELGLVRRSVEEAARHAILGLTRTYLTLSLRDIAGAVGTAGAVGCRGVVEEVVSLIAAGKVVASIGWREGGMVTFHDGQDEFEDSIAAGMLVAEIQRAVDVAKAVAKEDTALRLSRDFVGKFLMAEGKGEKGIGAGSMALADDSLGFM